MISLLIVEDNNFERGSLSECINWELVGIGSIMTAPDGLEGFEMIKKHSPDIVMTDIKMPRMDGLEMLDKINMLECKPKVIFCSAFEDFTYAQQAMRKGAANYLLKPVNQKELIQTIREVIGTIIDEKLYEDERKRYKEEYSHYINTMKTNFIKQLVLTEERKKNHGMYTTMGDIYLKMQSGYMVASIEISYKNDGITDKHYVNERILRELSHSSLQENTEFFFDDIGLLVMLLHSIKEQADSRKAVATLQEVFQIVQKRTPFEYFIGVSSIAMDITHLNLLYGESCSVLGRRVLLGYGHAEHYSKTETSRVHNLHDQTVLQEAIQNVVNKTIAAQDIESSFTELEKALCSHYAHDIQGIQSVLVKLVSDLLAQSHALYEVKTEFSEYEIYQNVIRARSLPGALSYVRMLCDNIHDRMATNSKNKTDKLVDQLISILKAEYHENITLHYLSKRVFLSPNYIRLIFKEKTQVSVLKYLVRIRMDKARELLRNSELTIGDIAGMVGYVNSSYFCTAFKSEMGLSPSDFRRLSKMEDQS